MRDTLIFLDVDAKDKQEAIRRTIDMMQASGAISSGDKFYQAVMEREALGSTAIGKGLALPHARTQYVDEIIIALTRLKSGIAFDAADGEPVELIFLLGTPIKIVGEYLSVLAKLSKIVKDDKTRKKLLKAKSAVEIKSIFVEAET
ncbi:PTS sugar transporter subunit IIA [candidate division KSB1 bacterium]|nr:MAG: PTS sugar transporter subunit IIA [candidate division KSB1 bacterium]